MMKLRCYGGPIHGKIVDVKYPGRGVFTSLHVSGEEFAYERQRYRPASGDWQVNVLCYGDASDYTASVLDDARKKLHDPSAFEYRGFSDTYEPATPQQ
jgi:hypothetical protein